MATTLTFRMDSVVKAHQLLSEFASDYKRMAE